MEDIQRALIERTQRKSPVGKIANAVGRFGTILATGKPPAEDTSQLDELIKYNTLQTGSPEFRMQEAQTRANMGVQARLDEDDAIRERDIERARKGGRLVDGGGSVSKPTQPVSGSSFGVNQPSEPNVPAIANQASSPLGNMPANGPRYINRMNKPEQPIWDQKLGVEVMAPAEYVTEVDPQYKAELENEAARKKEEGKLQVKRGDLAQVVDSFRSISNQMPRKYGLERFAQGAKNITARTMQNENDPLAAASSTYEGARNNLTVAVARLKDVGNLSKNEQDAARVIIPSDIDSPQVFETKMRYLDALAGAATPEDIKSLLNSFASGQPLPAQPEVSQIPENSPSANAPAGQLSDEEAYQKYLELKKRKR